MNGWNDRDVVEDRIREIRERIRRAVDRAGVPAREIARRGGLASETHIGLILSGETKSIRVDVLEAIAKGAGVSFEYLRTGREDALPDLEFLDESEDASFRAAARACLLLQQASPHAIDVVREIARGAPRAPAASAYDWFVVILGALRARELGITSG